jgi:N-acetyl-gamma-glutamyl-phosphate reductase/acetylglutamate kinase
MTSRDIRQIYQDRYAGEKLVKVVGEAPYVTPSHVVIA